VALTFDDLPINGSLTPGSKQSDYARDTVAVLQKYRMPPSYGFINAQKLERNPDGALALTLWTRAGNPLANHTYSHLDLSKNGASDFEREVSRNEPVLELLMPATPTRTHDWRWFRYPYLQEGDDLDKRRAVRAFLKQNGYRIAQTTLDYEDYLWNSPHARCMAKGDQEALKWLRESYLESAEQFLHLGRETSRAVFGRDINHVMLLHLGSFSSHILPDLFALLKREGYEVVTLEEAQSDPVYSMDPDAASKFGGTLTEQFMEVKKLPWPAFTDKPREKLERLCQ
jgi:peptidoglycan/xylan/chitin deacetylase (PgdA/CDA1 family)